MKHQNWINKILHQVTIVTLLLTPVFPINPASIPQQPPRSTFIPASPSPDLSPAKLNTHFYSVKTPPDKRKLNNPMAEGGNWTIYLPLVLNTIDSLAGGVIISPETGGSVSTSNQNAFITFHPDSLPAPIVAVVQEDEKALLPDNFVRLGPAIHVQAEWLANDQPVTVLDPEAQPIPNPGGKPTPPQSRYWATISIRLQPGQETNNRLAIARLDSQFGKWEILPTQLDTQAGVAVAQTDRLGSFALIENATFWSNGNASENPTSPSCTIASIGSECIVDADDGSGFNQPNPSGHGIGRSGRRLCRPLVIIPSTLGSLRTIQTMPQRWAQSIRFIMMA